MGGWSGVGKDTIQWDGEIQSGGVNIRYVKIRTTAGDYIFIDDGLYLGLYNIVSGQQTQLNLYTADGDGTDGNFINIFGVGTISDHGTNYEKCVLQWGASSSIYALKSIAGGTGTVRPLYLYTGANTSQLVLAIDGSVSMAGVLQTGGYKSSDGSAGITTSFSIRDETAALTHSFTFKNGLLTAHSTC